jgi:hemolysin D
MKFNVIKKADEHEFLPILAEIEEEPTSPLGRIILWFVLMIIVLAVIGLFVAKIDVVVSGRGLIIPEGEIKIVQPLEGGVISKINVKVGSYVKEGEVLMEIDPSVIDPDFNSKKENLERIGKEISFINDLLAGKKTVNRDPELGKYISMRENMLGQIDSKRAQISQLNEQTKSLRKELETTDELLAGEKTRLEKLELVKDIISYDDYKKSCDGRDVQKCFVWNCCYYIDIYAIRCAIGRD